MDDKDSSFKPFYIPNILEIAAQDLKEQQKEREEQRRNKHRTRQRKNYAKKKIMEEQGGSGSNAAVALAVLTQRSIDRTARSTQHMQSVERATTRCIEAMERGTTAGMTLLNQGTVRMQALMADSINRESQRVANAEQGDADLLETLLLQPSLAPRSQPKSSSSPTKSPSTTKSPSPQKFPSPKKSSSPPAYYKDLSLDNVESKMVLEARGDIGFEKFLVVGAIKDGKFGMDGVNLDDVIDLESIQMTVQLQNLVICLDVYGTVKPILQLDMEEVTLTPLSPTALSPLDPLDNESPMPFNNNPLPLPPSPVRIVSSSPPTIGILPKVEICNGCHIAGFRVGDDTDERPCNAVASPIAECPGNTGGRPGNAVARPIMAVRRGNTGERGDNTVDSPIPILIDAARDILMVLSKTTTEGGKESRNVFVAKYKGRKRFTKSSLIKMEAGVEFAALAIHDDNVVVVSLLDNNSVSVTKIDYNLVNVLHCSTVTEGTKKLVDLVLACVSLKVGTRRWFAISLALNDSHVLASVSRMQGKDQPLDLAFDETGNAFFLDAHKDLHYWYKNGNCELVDASVDLDKIGVGAGPFVFGSHAGDYDSKKDKIKDMETHDNVLLHVFSDAESNEFEQDTMTALGEVVSLGADSNYFHFIYKSLSWWVEEEESEEDTTETTELATSTDATD